MLSRAVKAYSHNMSNDLKCLMRAEVIRCAHFFRVCVSLHEKWHWFKTQTVNLSTNRVTVRHIQKQCVFVWLVWNQTNNSRSNSCMCECWVPHKCYSTSKSHSKAEFIHICLFFVSRYALSCIGPCELATWKKFNSRSTRRKKRKKQRQTIKLWLYVLGIVSF